MPKGPKEASVSRIIQLAKTEPALVVGLAQAVLAVLAASGLHFTTDQSGAILGATTAVLGLITAASTRPFAVASLTGLLTALGTLALAYGAHMPGGAVASVNALVVAFAALIVRGHVSPVASLRKPPVPSPSPVPPRAA